MNEPATLHDQRYYHVVALQRDENARARDIWRGLGQLGGGRVPDSTFDWGRVQHRTIETQDYLGGAFDSTGRGASARFVYDVFSVNIRTPTKPSCILVGVPYLGVGRHVAMQLREAGAFRDSSFLKVDLATLISAVRRRDPRVLAARISKIQMRIDDDPEVNGFSISGDNALFSSFYERMVSSLRRKAVVVQRCTVGFTDLQFGGLSTHCDVFGNFRIWLRKGAANVGALYGLFELFRAAGVLEDAPGIPYFRASEPDSP